jgi:hypothetical protein
VSTVLQPLTTLTLATNTRPVAPKMAPGSSMSAKRIAREILDVKKEALPEGELSLQWNRLPELTHCLVQDARPAPSPTSRCTNGPLKSVSSTVLILR